MHRDRWRVVRSDGLTRQVVSGIVKVSTWTGGNMERIQRAIWCAALLGLMTSISAPVQASGKYVDCVIVTKAVLQPFVGSLGPQYDITVENGCNGIDVGSVDIKFDSGSYDVFTLTGWSIWNLTSWGERKSFYLTNIKPGYYSPKVTITVNKDWSSKTVQLPSYSILAAAQPDLGRNGGGVTLEPSSAPSASSRKWCVTTPYVTRDCYKYPNWHMEMCSSNASAKLQERVSSTWTTLWNVKGKKSATCGAKHPYLYMVNGKSRTTSRKVHLRLAFQKTLTLNGFSTNFSLNS